LAEAAAAVERATSARPDVAPEVRRVSAPVGSGADALVAAVRELDRAGIATDDIGLRRPTLDEVFLRLTGRTAYRAHDEEEAA
jgi:ABC-2 type transport system ATP-binding protein